MSATTYTSDPTDVTAIIWPIASERVAAYDGIADEYIDSPHDGIRMQIALDRLAELAHEHYPNLTSAYVHDGGFENQYSAMAPRAETASGAVYEPFEDDMIRLEDDALAYAWSLVQD